MRVALVALAVLSLAGAGCTSLLDFTYTLATDDMASVDLVGAPPGDLTGIERRVFVSSTTYGGDFGLPITGPCANLTGVTLANCLCTELAKNLPTPLGRPWVAWLSTTQKSARDVVGPGPWWMQTGGTRVQVFPDGLVMGPPMAAIEHNEHGSPDGSNDPVWTGSTNEGISTGNVCNNWSDSTVQFDGESGEYRTASEWSQRSSSPDVCAIASTHHVYCFEL